MSNFTKKDLSEIDDLKKNLNYKLCKEFVNSRNINPITKKRIDTNIGLTKDKSGHYKYALLWKACEDIFKNDVLVPSYTFKRVEAGGGGDCLYHSIAYVFGWGKHQGLRLRSYLSDEFNDSMDHFFELNNGMTALVELNQKLILPENAYLSNIRLPKFNDNKINVYKEIDKLNPNNELVTDVKIILEDIWREYVHSIETIGIWGEEWVIDFASKINEVNMFIYNSKNHILTTAREIVPGWECMFIYNYDNNHFQPMESKEINPVTKTNNTKFTWEESLPIIKEYIDQNLVNDFQNLQM